MTEGEVVKQHSFQEEVLEGGMDENVEESVKDEKVSQEKSSGTKYTEEEVLEGDV